MNNDQIRDKYIDPLSRVYFAQGHNRGCNDAINRVQEEIDNEALNQFWAKEDPAAQALRATSEKINVVRSELCDVAQPSFDLGEIFDLIRRGLNVLDSKPADDASEAPENENKPAQGQGIGPGDAKDGKFHVRLSPANAPYVDIRLHTLKPFLIVKGENWANGRPRVFVFTGYFNDPSGVLNGNPDDKLFLFDAGFEVEPMLEARFPPGCRFLFQGLSSDASEMLMHAFNYFAYDEIDSDVWKRR